MKGNLHIVFIHMHCSSAEFGSGVYAILKGKVVEFMMTSHSVTLGRNSAAGQVDFDLSMEAPAFKISRKQVLFSLVNTLYMMHSRLCMLIFAGQH